MATSKKQTFPYQFEMNGRKGKIYRTSSGKFKTHFVFAHRTNQNTFASFENAKLYLSREFDKLDTNIGDSGSQYVLSRDRKYYHELEALLRVEADGATLRDTVDFYLTMRPKTKFKPATVSECLRKFLEEKKAAKVSSGQLKSLKKHLSRFSRVFGTKNMHELTSEEINKWLLSQKDKKSNSIWSNKYRYNVLGSLVTFAIYARDTYKAFPNAFQPTEFELVRKPKKEITDEVEIYTPDEIQKLLRTCVSHDLEILPLIVLGAFFGLRPSEAHGEDVDRPKLRWESLDFINRLLHLRGQKVRSKPTRQVPIQANACLWLKPFKKQIGDIWTHRAAYDERLSGICKKAGCQKIPNGFRHSYTSYRLIHLKHDYKALAAELGNSEREIINSYRRNVLPKDADRWFAVKPPKGYQTRVRAYLSSIAP
jgi:integrase